MHGLLITSIIRTLSVAIRLDRLPGNRKVYMLLGANNRKFIIAVAGALTKSRKYYFTTPPSTGLTPPFRINELNMVYEISQRHYLSYICI